MIVLSNKINVGLTPKNEKTEKNDLFDGRDPGATASKNADYDQSLNVYLNAFTRRDLRYTLFGSEKTYKKFPNNNNILL